jgi:soluble lytic murein transglycosylase-like protein
MRVMSVVLGVLMVASVAHADVRIAVKSNGKKVIYNVGSMPKGTSGSALKWLAKQHDRRSKYDAYIEQYATRYGVDATFVRAVIQVESNFNPRCVSNKGARGLMQLMPETAKRFGVKDSFDPEQNIHGGVKFLAYLMRLFNGDMHRVLAGYNAGENAVLKYGGIPPYQETSQYVVRAMTVYHGRPYGGGISYAGARSGGRKLRGGFGIVGNTAPLAAALIPGAKVLGSR